MHRLAHEEIARLLGDDAARLLRNRNRGGQSGFSGSRYEVLFGVHRIARLLRKLSSADAVVEWQSNGFIDDFVVRRDATASLKAYQLKNSAEVSWTAGDNPIERDFSWQHQVSKAEGYSDIRLRLVCSDLPRCEVLKREMPGCIQPYSKAFFFPYGEPFLGALAEFSWLLEDFAFLSKHPVPTKLDALQVAEAIMGAWTMLAPVANVSAIFKKARTTSPALLRVLFDEDLAANRLTPEFTDTLSRLPGFEYHVERGFFHWAVPGALSKGALSFDCFDPRFARFQQHVVRQQPRSFEDIEGALQ